MMRQIRPLERDANSPNWAKKASAHKLDTTLDTKTATFGHSVTPCFVDDLRALEFRA